MGWLADYKRDLQRYVDDGTPPLKALLTQQGLWALFEYRLACVGRRIPFLQPFFVAWHKVIEATTGISLGHNARLGPGLWITRFGGIIVHDGVVVGGDCHLCQGVTIGHGPPVVGDGVYFGPNAVVLGKVTIGDRSRILANSFVTEDVPPDTIVRPAPVSFDEGPPADGTSEPAGRPTKA